MEPIQDAHELQGYLRRLIFNIIPNLVPGDIITIARESQGPSPSYSFQHKKEKEDPLRARVHIQILDLSSPFAQTYTFSASFSIF